jgi:hypothetical protein
MLTAKQQTTDPIKIDFHFCFLTSKAESIPTTGLTIFSKYIQELKIKNKKQKITSQC